MDTLRGTPEQIEAAEREQEKARLATRDGQAGEFRDALREALIVVNNEISQLGAQPRIDSVIQALTMLQAEFVAMEPTRLGRRRMLGELQHNLKRLVALRGDTATPAKVLKDEVH